MTTQIRWGSNATNEAWGLLGPRAVTQAWVDGTLLAEGAHLYAARTFGYVTCGAAFDGLRHEGGSFPSSWFDGGWGGWFRTPQTRCTEFSSSALPIDCDVSNDEWLAYRSQGTLVQHGLKSLWARRDDPSSVTCVHDGPRSLRHRLVAERCPASWLTSVRANHGQAWLSRVS